MSKIVLFYKYVPIRYPVQVQKWQRRLCTSLGLVGRVIIAHEGINATLGGTQAALESYVAAMQAHELFGGIDFKISDGSGDDFPRLAVMVKAEIVNLGINPEVLTVAQGGRHLNPAEAHELLASDEQNIVVFDARNKYESDIGAFEGAIKPPIENFRELPAYIDEHLEEFRDKTVVMYCTGGVRCERASAYLNTKRVAKEVLQIEGGIHRYVEAYPEGFFRGKNYVFDGRGAMRVNDDILGTCIRCSQPCDRQISCSNPACRYQLIICPTADVRHENTRCEHCL